MPMLLQAVAGAGCVPVVFLWGVRVPLGERLSAAVLRCRPLVCPAPRHHQTGGEPQARMYF